MTSVQSGFVHTTYRWCQSVLFANERVLLRSITLMVASPTTFRSWTRTQSRCRRSPERVTFVLTTTRPTLHTSTWPGPAYSSLPATCTAWPTHSSHPTLRSSATCVSRALTMPCDIYSATVSARWLSHDGFVCDVVVSFAKDQLGVLVLSFVLWFALYWYKLEHLWAATWNNQLKQWWSSINNWQWS